jgi:glutathione synthase/RimK-type ligase-like ATP-grasp enzyme
MKNIVVVEDPRDWSLPSSDVETVSAQEYLTRPDFAQTKGTRVFNLCRSYRYQTMGYYVSLLAAARGHKPLPSVSTIVDFSLVALHRLAGEEVQELIDRAMAPLQSDRFTLSIYFGRNVAKRYDRLCTRIFRLFPAPLIRCTLAREEGRWRLKSIKPIPLSDIPDEHLDTLRGFAAEFFAGKSMPSAQADLGSSSRFHMAILVNPDEPEAPSDPKAIAKFRRAAEKAGISSEVITKDDYGRIAEFDALFIRETTNVNHHTFRFARRSQAEGLVVIDDPDSILRCSNKVFLAELLTRARIPTPRTVIGHRSNLDSLPDLIGLPCILKQPDSAFSRGVVKVDTREQLAERARALLKESDLFIAQEFMPTEYDWRVGVIDGEPLFACRYHMARKHWQVVHRDEGNGKASWGKTETLPLWSVPPHVVQAALQACAQVGTGLYGVDLKEVNGKCYVMEVNDNPDINAGDEDAFAKDELYGRIIAVFLRRLEKSKEGKSPK